jgi:C1A family cysteine protease
VAKSGIVPQPKPNEDLVGGHCVAAVGYDDWKQAFLCRNSWGESWGLSGYFWLPYTFLVNPQLSSDFWKITFVQ